MSEGKAKFTPGPWAILDVGGIDRYPGIEAPDKDFSVVVFGDEDNDFRGVQGNTKEEAIANAALIAAAPDMYAALENALRDMDMIDEVCSLAGVPRFALMREDIATTLAKSRGESI